MTTTMHYNAHKHTIETDQGETVAALEAHITGEEGFKIADSWGDSGEEQIEYLNDEISEAETEIQRLERKIGDLEDEAGDDEKRIEELESELAELKGQDEE